MGRKSKAKARRKGTLYDYVGSFQLFINWFFQMNSLDSLPSPYSKFTQ